MGTNTPSRPRQIQGPTSARLESLWGMEVDEDWVSTGQELGSQSRPPTGQGGREGSELNLFPGGILGGEVAYDCHLVAICCYDKAEWAGAVTSGSK